MKKLRIAANLTFILAIISVFSIVVQFLALSDIANGEPDLNLEWKIVGYSMLVIFMFVVSVFTLLALLWQKNKIK